MGLGIKATPQQGMVMLTTMILLIAVTLMIVTASNLVQTNLKVVQNMESREQARYAAIAAIEEAVSDGDFIETPDDIFNVASTCGTQKNTKCYDTNGNGSFDVTVKFVDPPPRCVMKTPKKNSELRPYTNPAEAACFSTGSPFSLCAESVWEFVAVATDEVTGAEVVVRQGVSIESTANDLSFFCPDPT
jgi:hypothetical protein